MGSIRRRDVAIEAAAMIIMLEEGKVLSKKEFDAIAELYRHTVTMVI